MLSRIRGKKNKSPLKKSDGSATKKDSPSRCNDGEIQDKLVSIFFFFFFVTKKRFFVFSYDEAVGFLILRLWERMVLVKLVLYGNIWFVFILTQCHFLFKF